jgi:hypothetical protein
MGVLVPCTPCAGQKHDSAERLTKIDIERATNQQLIDYLVNVSKFGAGFHPTAWVSGFIAVEGEPRFEGGILGSTKPSVNPAMKELVKRGVKALPDLIAHLSDEREIRLSISQLGFGGATWHSDEYDPRYKDEKRLPKEVNTGKEEELTKPYALRVGDLCYVAVGQIVNRRLNAVRYQPSGCYVINSPVATPKLAAVVKREWAGLTAEDHERSLVSDAQTPYFAGPPPALERLAFYYPNSAEKVATELLSRQLYDNDVVWKFIQHELVKHTTEGDWTKLIQQFRKQNGKRVSDSIPYWLHWIYWMASFEHSKEFMHDRKIARQILDKLYPEFDPHNPPVFDAAELSDQVAIVFAIRHLKSRRVDDAIHKLFVMATQNGSELRIQTDELDELARLAVERPATNEKRLAYAPYFADRLGQLKKELAQIKGDTQMRRDKADEVARVERLLKSIKD